MYVEPVPVKASLYRTFVGVGVRSRQNATEHPGVSDVQVGAVHDELQPIGCAETADVIDDVDAGEQTRLVDVRTDAGRLASRVRHEVVVRYVEAATSILHTIRYDGVY